jgi:hypothetical protein
MEKNYFYICEKHNKVVYSTMPGCPACIEEERAAARVALNYLADQVQGCLRGAVTCGFCMTQRPITADECPTCKTWRSGDFLTDDEREVMFQVRQALGTLPRVQR